MDNPSHIQAYQYNLIVNRYSQLHLTQFMGKVKGSFSQMTQLRKRCFGQWKMKQAKNYNVLKQHNY